MSTRRAIEDRTPTVSASEPLPEPATGIQPGSQLIITIENAGTFGCSANFVWKDTSTTLGDFDDERGNSPVFDGDRHPLYVGAAGHCFLAGGKNAAENARREGRGRRQLPAGRPAGIKIIGNVRHQSFILTLRYGE